MCINLNNKRTLVGATGTPRRERSEARLLILRASSLKLRNQQINDASVNKERVEMSGMEAKMIGDERADRKLVAEAQES
jgi:hypothetical protein